MRDRYLFRGKQDDGKWAIGHYISCDVIGHEIYCHREGVGYEIDPATIGQCTGLRDKNGTLIFEGDIAKSTCTYVVTWHSYDPVSDAHAAEWILKAVASQYYEYFFNVPNLEIIGNIHDNPELLER